MSLVLFVLLVVAVLACAVALVRERVADDDRRIARRLAAMSFRPERDGW